MEFEPKTPTRSDYMNGRATHQGYYGAIVREAGISLGFWTRLERVKQALAAGDEHLNTIPLKLWDDLAHSQRRAVEPVLREHGDFWSLASGVCVAKEAARQAASQRRCPACSGLLETDDSPSNGDADWACNNPACPEPGYHEPGWSDGLLLQCDQPRRVQGDQ